MRLVWMFTFAVVLAVSGAAVVHAGEPGDCARLPMPDREWVDAYQKELVARTLRKALRAIPLFGAAAPDLPVPLTQDPRWCRRAAAANAIRGGCRWGTLDPELCARAQAVFVLDDPWWRSRPDPHQMDRERECRDDAEAAIDDREEN